ncbi:MAG: hypothetical protein J6Y07_00475, partial [Alphaproteobacteria bacterium]|nr:hypothetical protein [Alphaproteobacteria bacterium]
KMYKRFFAVLLILVIGVAAHATEPDDATKRKTVTSQHYVDSAIETKQPVIQAQSGNYVVVYPNSSGSNTAYDEDGEVNKRHISTTLTTGSAPSGGDGVSVTSTDIPTVGAVNDGLSNKQQKLSGTSGKLVTFGGTTGTVGSTDVYSTESGATYANQMDALVRAQDVNGAVANGFSDLLTCREYEGGHEGDPDYCWLWIVNTDMASGVYVPQGQ